MHPILGRKVRPGPYLAVCLPLCAILVALLARPGAFSLVEALVIAGPLTLIYVFLGLSAWYPSRSLALSRSKLPRLLVTHAVGALLTSSFWVFDGAVIAWLLALHPHFAGLRQRYADQAPALFAAGILLYVLSAAFHYVLLALETAREAEKKEAQLRILAREAELKALKAQIHPHFLFNSLNSISALVGSDPGRAREMCVGLADFLRKSLALGERKSIRIGEELALAKSYLEVERVRFGKRLAVEEEIAPGGEECLVPPLLLQPLVENAVVHGIATLVEGGVVRLEARQTGHRLRIVIENPFDPDAPARPRGGLGLKIVRQRLAALYGNEAIFAAKRLDGRHLAVISIPAQA